MSHHDITFIPDPDADSISSDERGGLPPGVVFFDKPINYDELRGYLRACCAQFQRQVK